MNIGGEHLQAEDWRDAWLANVADGGEVLEVFFNLDNPGLRLGEPRFQIVTSDVV